MARTVSRKMGTKEETRTHFVNAPASTLKALAHPCLTFCDALQSDFGYIHFFALSKAEMDNMFPKLKAHLGASGMLWVSWPAGQQLDTDLTLPHVINVGNSHTLVKSTALIVDGHMVVI